MSRYFSTVIVKSFSLIVVISILMFATHSNAQDIWQMQSRSKSIDPPECFNYIPKKIGHYTAEDWQTVIDSTWGEGWSTERRTSG